jgi:hypothetical protein
MRKRTNNAKPLPGKKKSNNSGCAFHKLFKTTLKLMASTPLWMEAAKLNNH